MRDNFSARVQMPISVYEIKSIRSKNVKSVYTWSQMKLSKPIKKFGQWVADALGGILQGKHLLQTRKNVSRGIIYFVEQT